MPKPRITFKTKSIPFSEIPIGSVFYFLEDEKNENIHFYTKIKSNLEVDAINVGYETISIENDPTYENKKDHCIEVETELILYY